MNTRLLRMVLLHNISGSIVLFFMGILFSLHAQTLISGTIKGGTMFIKDGNPYIIESDVTIPHGENVVIGKGCRFYFKPFSGIIVEGDLKVTGTIDEPVLFTSINDSSTTDNMQPLPNPFDWNGIFITTKAGNVELSNFTLSYSVYGVKSQKKSFTIKNGTFRHNGQYHCTINETIMQVADGIPFTYASHAVIYDPNGAASGKVPVDSLHYNQGMMVKVLGNSGKLVVPNHSFSGWNSTFDGKGTDYPEGTTIVMGEHDIRLYAKWSTAGEKGKSTGVSTNVGYMQTPGKKTAPFIVGGAGLVCGGVSLYFLKGWLDGKDDYDAIVSVKERERLNDESKVTSAVSISTGVISVAAITTGIILLLRNKSGEGPVVVAPVVSPGVAGGIIIIRM